MKRVKFLVLVSISLLAGCGGSGLRFEDPVEVVRADFLGCTWNASHAAASIVSQDGGSSYPADGRSVWWFGDTFRGRRDAQGKPQFEGGGVSCCVALMDTSRGVYPPTLTYFTGSDGRVAQAIDFLPGESWDRHRIWPLGGVFCGGRSYIYYELIELDGKGGFDGIGTGLARSEQPLAVHERVQGPSGWRFPAAPSAVLAVEGWLYFYEIKERNHLQGLWLSRVRPEAIENPDAYEFYAGSKAGFGPDPAAQQLLAADIHGQASVVWNAYLNRYVLAASSDFWNPRRILFYTAESPQGPWKTAFAVTVPSYRQGKKVSLVYCAFLHPELFGDNGRVMNLTFACHLEDAGFDANTEMLEIEIRDR